MAIATGTALMAGASVVGGLAQASAAKKAARAQTKAADQQVALQREVYEDQTQRFQPYLEGGGNALGAYMYELGLGDAPTIGGSPMEITEIPGTPAQAASPQYQNMNFMGKMALQRLNSGASAGDPRYSVGGNVFDTREQAEAYAQANPTGGTQYEGISMSPGAQFALQEGRDTVEAGAAHRGGLNSGATLEGLERLRMGLAAKDRDSQLNRLAGLTDMGQGAAGMQASAGNAFANMASTSLANKGNAQAAGAIGAGNAFSGMMDNLSGIYGYQQMMNQPQQSSMAPTTSLRPVARPF